jgi:hypothetical protein
VKITPYLGVGADETLQVYFPDDPDTPKYYRLKWNRVGRNKTDDIKQLIEDMLKGIGD